MTSMEQWLGSRNGGVDTGEIMAILSVTQDKLAQALTILQIIAPKLDDIYNGQVGMRQNIADLLVGAGVPDSVAAQVDALLLAAQLDESKINAALALLAQPLPPPTVGGGTTPPPPPTISLSVNTLAATAPGSVQLIPTVSADVTKVECYQDGALIFTKNAAPFDYTVTGLAARQQPYTFTEKAFGPGGTTMSNAVQVSIAAATGPVQVDPIT